MRIAVLSDTHGYVPDVPDADLLILSGDYTHTRKNDWAAQCVWTERKFKPWLAKIRKRMPIVGVAGNHDYIFEKYRLMLPPLDWIYLEDSGCEINGLKIWGSPVNLAYKDYSFNRKEYELVQHWKEIPDDTNLLVLHQPPLGIADKVPSYNFDGEHVGSYTLYDRLSELNKLENLKLVTCGHLHSNTGVYPRPFKFPVVNGSYVGEDYLPCGKAPVIIDI